MVVVVVVVSVVDEVVVSVVDEVGSVVGGAALAPVVPVEGHRSLTRVRRLSPASRSSVFSSVPASAGRAFTSSTN